MGGLTGSLLYLASLGFLGIIVGLFGAMLGLGGGIIMVPTLILLAGFDAHHAIGTSMAAIAFTGTSSTLAYYRQGRLDWKLALVAEAATMPGSFLGAMLTSLISSEELELLLSILLIALALSVFFKRGEGGGHSRGPKASHEGRLVWRRVIIDSEGKIFHYSINVLAFLPACFMAGIISGFFGIGGGSMKVPILHHLGAPIHVAIATSTMMIALTALSGAIGHLTLGHIKPLELLALAPGIVLGTRLGASITRKLRSATLRKLFSLALLLMAISLLMR